jgi:DNA gyrase/topoisomerase IV subunit A
MSVENQKTRLNLKKQIDDVNDENILNNHRLDIKVKQVIYYEEQQKRPITDIHESAFQHEIDCLKEQVIHLKDVSAKIDEKYQKLKKELEEIEKKIEQEESGVIDREETDDTLEMVEKWLILYDDVRVYTRFLKDSPHNSQNKLKFLYKQTIFFENELDRVAELTNTIEDPEFDDIDFNCRYGNICSNLRYFRDKLLNFIDDDQWKSPRIRNFVKKQILGND